MTLLSALFLTYSESHAQDAEILRVPAGWTASNPGYWLSNKAARDIAAGWSADRESVRVLRQGLADLKSEMDAANADTRRLLEELRAEINKERAAYNKKIRASKGQGILLGVIIGAVAGAVAAK